MLMLGRCFLWSVIYCMLSLVVPKEVCVATRSYGL